MASLYDDITITQVRFMVRELFTLLDYLTISKRTDEEIKTTIKRVHDIAEILDHSKWTMERF